MSFYKTDQILSCERNLLLEERRRCVWRGHNNIRNLRKTEEPQGILYKCDFREGEWSLQLVLT